VFWALSTRCDPSEDIDTLRNTWSTGLDPSRYPAAERPYGSKALINACKPHRNLKDFPKSTLLRKSTYDSVVSRWTELGFETTPPHLTVFHEE
jgi:3-polyprenyl-4-hydroxybenzoate decarboxylase